MTKRLSQEDCAVLADRYADFAAQNVDGYRAEQASANAAVALAFAVMALDPGRDA
jgi:hypothetical protein